MVGTVWWLIVCFLYIKNDSSDPNLRVLGGWDTLPVFWWWERLDGKDDNVVYLVWSLVTGFFFYLFVSVGEFVAWIIYETGNLGWAQWYFRTIGYWGSCILYAFPFILMVLQIGVKGQKNFPGNWAVVFLCIEGAFWLTSGAIHIWFID